MVESDHEATSGVEVAKQKWNWQTALGITEEFSRGDKIIYGITVGKAILFFGLWIGMTVAVYTVGVSKEGWATYHYYVNAMFFIATSFIASSVLRCLQPVFSQTIAQCLGVDAQ